MRLVRNTQQVDLLTEACLEAQDTGTTEFGNLTYEEGILSTVRWMTDKEAEYPLSVEGSGPLSDDEEETDEDDEDDESWNDGEDWED